MKHPCSEQREKILDFYQRHGVQATCEAFEVSRRTLFRWQSLRRHNGHVAPRTTAPQRRRQRRWPEPLLQQIRRMRQEHPNLGKEKIHPLLQAFCQQTGLVCPSVSTIGRLIADGPNKMRQIPVKLDARGRRKQVCRSKPKTRKPKGFRASKLGEGIALDTVERVKDGLKRYLISMTDVTSRLSFTVATTSHSSQAAKEFFCLGKQLFPGTISRVLSDNGTEFEGMFGQYLLAEEIPRWYTYPRTPKMNAHAERYNRTLQEEFVDYHEELLFSDLPAFNEKLAEWLIWFNTVRPHYSLENQSPLQYIAKYQCALSWAGGLIG